MEQPEPAEPGSEDPPRAVFAAALTRLRRQLPHLSDEMLAGRVSRTALPSGRRITVNARRLGEWLGGRSVPRDFRSVVAVVRAVESAIDPGGFRTSIAEWERLWRAAYDDRAGASPTRPAAALAVSVPTAPAPAAISVPAAVDGPTADDVPDDVVVGRPPSDAASLRRRAALSNAIEAALLDESVREVVLTGTGGAGKSQLAAATFHRARRPGGIRVWVPASSRQSVLTAYARAWRVVSGEGGGRGWDDETQADLFIAWLRTTPRPWLVVLDDVDDPADLRGIRPVGDRGKTLMTTRRRDAALIRPSSRIVRVGMFAPEEAVGYLRSRLAVNTDSDSDRDSDTDEAGAGDRNGAGDRDVELAALADTLGHFPLALSQAAAFLIDTGMPLTTYRRLFDDQRETLSDLLPATSPADEHSDTVETAWKLALDRAEALAPAGSARATLELVSMLAPDGIAEAVLHTAAARAWIEAAMTANQNTAHQNTAHRDITHPDTPLPDTNRPTAPHARSVERAVLLALRALHRLSLVTHDPSRTPASVEVHALVQRATRETVPAHALPGLAVAAADAMEELWSATAESAYGPDTEAALYRGVEALRRTAPGGLLWEGRMHPVLRRVGPYLAELGRDAAERDVCRELLAQARARLGDGHRDVLVLRGQVARATGELGETAAALDSLVEIRREAERTLGPTDPDTLTVRLHEARFRMEAGAAAEALDDFTELADQAASVLGTDHALVIDTLRNAALCRSLSGDAVGARDSCAAIVTVVERQFGPRHPVTLSVLTDLGRYEGEAGDPQGAVATYVRAVAGLEATVGRLHRDTLIARHNLAYWRGLAGERALAVEEFTVAAEDAERALGPGHPTTLTYRVNLAFWRGLSGDPAVAVAELATLLPTVDKVMGPDHPRALRTRRQHAEVLALSGDHTGSAALLAALLADMTRVHGKDHPRTREVAESLANPSDHHPAT